MNRRGFLKRLGLGVIAAPVAASVAKDIKPVNNGLMYEEPTPAYEWTVDDLSCGNREDLVDVLCIIKPEETPLLVMRK